MKNQVNEFSVGAEINYYDFNLHGNDKKNSSLLIFGVGFIRYNLFYHEPNTLENIGYGKGIEITPPAIVGLKANVSPYVVLGLEIGGQVYLPIIWMEALRKRKTVF